jgi:hypothetical protein
VSNSRQMQEKLNLDLNYGHTSKHKEERIKGEGQEIQAKQKRVRAGVAGGKLKKTKAGESSPSPQWV